MSDEPNYIIKQPTKIAVLGSGCAALSLAANINLLSDNQLHVIAPEVHKSDQDHIWGFWEMDWLQDAVPLARKTWHKWAVRNTDTEVIMHADAYPYHAITRRTWLEHCNARAQENDVFFHEDMTQLVTLSPKQVFDSRPPRREPNMMLQHFIGWEIRAEPGSFDDSTAILMDFRCDQSRGMHFIYCLPFSDREALVESTLFSPTLETNEFYETAISSWLKKHAGVSRFNLLRREQGAIPLGVMKRHDPDFQGIGANGGAIRPSSGYAFSFIQKQIDTALKYVSDGHMLQFATPHKPIDLWMDKIFLSVLRYQPRYASKIFIALAGSLTGDEFARFLSGEANISLRAKVVAAMPSLPFIRALLRPDEGES